jgi:hypothetical protein
LAALVMALSCCAPFAGPAFSIVNKLSSAPVHSRTE